MRKFYTFIVILITVTLSISILISLKRNLAPIVLDILSIMTAAQSVISLYLVYLLYDRFGTSKKILDKQNEIIIEFLDVLKKTRLYITQIYPDNKRSVMYLSIKKDLSWVKESKAQNKRIMFRSDELYAELGKFENLIDHPLFPIELNKYVYILKPTALLSDPDFNKEEFVYISFKNEMISLEDQWMTPHNEKITLYAYMSNMEKIIKELEQWINKESSIKINLNYN